MKHIQRKLQLISPLQSKEDIQRYEITQRNTKLRHDFESHSHAFLTSKMDVSNLEKTTAWMRRNYYEISININPYSTLYGHGERMLKILVETPSCLKKRLTVEITEHSAGMRHKGNRDALRKALEKIKETGCRLSLDDYGTGESNAERLLWSVWDEVKIAGEIGRKIHTHKEIKDYCTAVINMARQAGVSTVIENLDTEDGIQVARELGADYGQGYAINMPSEVYF